jgi:hypothetical protein
LQDFDIDASVSRIPGLDVSGQHRSVVSLTDAVEEMRVDPVGALLDGEAR